MEKTVRAIYIKKVINPFARGQQRLYAKLYLNEESENFIDSENNTFYPFQVHFSLINDGVIKLDRIFTESYLELENYYAPFIFEFSGYFNSKEQAKIFWENYRLHSSNYIVCSLLFNKQEHDNNLIFGQVVFGVNTLETVDAVLKLNFELPPDLDTLKFLDDPVYQIDKYSTLKKENDYELKTAVQKILTSNDYPEMAVVYNVGQGSNISVFTRDNKCIMFDVGLTNSPIELKLSEVQLSQACFSLNRPDIVILSHWDNDHILGVLRANISILKALWIVPDQSGLYGSKKKNGKYTYLSDFALRLFKFLVLTNGANLFVVPDKLKNMQVYRDNYMMIYTGERKSTSKTVKKKKIYSINKANNFGLIVTLHRHFHTLLPGDCDYKLMSWLKKEEYHNIVASHHGSKMDFTNIKKLRDKGTVIFSYGIANSYRHPSPMHIGEMQKRNYEVHFIIGRVCYCFAL